MFNEYTLVNYEPQLITVFVKLLSGDLLTVEFDPSYGKEELYRMTHFNLCKRDKECRPIWCMQLFPSGSEEIDEWWMPKDGDTIDLLVRDESTNTRISWQGEETHVYDHTVIDRYIASFSFVADGETRTMDIEFYQDQEYHHFISSSEVERFGNGLVSIHPLTIKQSAPTIERMIYNMWEEDSMDATFPSYLRSVLAEQAQYVWNNLLKD